MNRRVAHIEKRRRRSSVVWRARYRGPDGAERSRTFARKTDAEAFLTKVEDSKLRGEWVDPSLGKTRVREFADQWLAQVENLKGDLKEIRDKAKSKDMQGVQAVVPQATQHNKKANQLATQLGMTVCSKD